MKPEDRNEPQMCQQLELEGNDPKESELGEITSREATGQSHQHLLAATAPFNQSLCPCVAG